jgi:hypothetical protein
LNFTCRVFEAKELVLSCSNPLVSSMLS